MYNCLNPVWITQGDSLQTGNGLSPDFVETVTASLSGPIVNVRQAVGGTTCPQAYSNFVAGTDLNPSGLSAKDAIRLYRGAKSVLISLQCGVNDWIQGNSAATAYTGITDWVTAVKAHCTTYGTNCLVLVATVTDSCNIYLGGAETTFRAALNSSITGGAVANGYTVVDYASATHLGADGDSQNSTYFQTPQVGCATGGVHYTSTGMAIQATTMEAAMASVSFP